MEIENDALTQTIIGCAITVHRALGVGLLESAYQYFLSHELAKAGLEVRQQPALPVTYDGATFDLGFRPDLIVNSKVIVEVKAIAAFLPIHRAQVLTYLRFAELDRGLLINFHCEPLIKGIKRVERPARPSSSFAGEQRKVL